MPIPPLVSDLDRKVPREILAAIGKELDRPVVARARSPAWDDGVDAAGAWDDA